MMRLIGTKMNLMMRLIGTKMNRPSVLEHTGPKF